MAGSSRLGKNKPPLGRLQNTYVLLSQQVRTSPSTSTYLFVIRYVLVLHKSAPTGNVIRATPRREGGEWLLSEQGALKECGDYPKPLRQLPFALFV